MNLGAICMYLHARQCSLVPWISVSLLFWNPWRGLWFTMWMSCWLPNSRRTWKDHMLLGPFQMAWGSVFSISYVTTRPLQCSAEFRIRTSNSVELSSVLAWQPGSSAMMREEGVYEPGQIQLGMRTREEIRIIYTPLLGSMSSLYHVPNKGWFLMTPEFTERTCVLTNSVWHL